MRLDKDFDVGVTASVDNFAFTGIDSLARQLFAVVTPDGNGGGISVFDVVLNA